MVAIQWGFEDGHRLQIAEILYESLGKKFIPVFGKRDSCVPCISAILRPERTLTATTGNQVAGIAGLQFKGSGYLDTRLRTLTHYLRFGVLKAIFNGWLLESKVRDDELHFDTIAVTPRFRGLGIGSQLIRHVIDFAGDEGFSCIKLFVINTNSRAKRLYERLGFDSRAHTAIPFPWSRTFGFSEAVEMVLALN